ncbi:alcohol dehydrogenase catalytic domain-containing protein [Microlunatus sp. Y2014]|uniref:alcohol dehydrogenase catalytic domain-containing protein n=1 Tax=Microlunatus sp. Y2014 TaxID=3418488 RepID=UPI003DA6FE0D
MEPGDVLGHEAMGVVEEVGTEVGDLAVGDRVVVPFQISCGHCWMCDRSLYTQCETTQVREQGSGAALFGYSKLYGQVAGGQAEYLRVPQAQFTHVKVPPGPPDDRFIYLSDVLPTAQQAVAYADVPDGGTLVVLGLGPIGDMACRLAAHGGLTPNRTVGRVIGVDRVPERLARARARGIETVDLREHGDDLADLLRDWTEGRGPDAVIDAVGMEAHGSPVAGLVQRAAGMLPGAVAEPLISHAGVDRMAALYAAIDIVRRGGTVSVIGVYGGMVDPMPMMTMFDKQVQLRMGQANVKRWVGELLPLLTDADPLGVDDFATHRLPLAEAPHAYDIFQRKADGAVKVILKP